MDKDNRMIARVEWEGESELTPAFGQKLKMINEFHGDYDIDWIVVIENGQEIARHNPRYVSYIEWEPMGDDV